MEMESLSLLANNLTVDDLFTFLGIISSISFVIVAVGDFFIAVGSIIVGKFFRDRNRLYAKRIVLIWDTIIAIYEEFRKFIDKLSAMSRPRKDH